jgi:hypothetical protein
MKIFFFPFFFEANNVVVKPRRNVPLVRMVPKVWAKKKSSGEDRLALLIFLDQG